MTDQPTPETDAIAFVVGNRSIHPTTIVVAVNDARTMEIQRNAARADVARLRAAMELIACPMRPDGTYNRDRGACGSIARGALASLLQ